jgi:hypothetical protein
MWTDQLAQKYVKVPAHAARGYAECVYGVQKPPVTFLQAVLG